MSRRERELSFALLLHLHRLVCRDESRRRRLQLGTIYSQIAHFKQRRDYKVDALLTRSDTQVICNEQDLRCMAVLNKYPELGELYK